MTIQAMSTATTGLQALSTDIDVISNNLANVNTVGFKSSRANFEDLLYQQQQLANGRNNEGMVQPAGLQVGLGTRISNTEALFTEGPQINTGNNLDVAIQGNGFFQVQTFAGTGGGTNSIGYTRAGNFFRNRDGMLVLGNSDGFVLQPPITIPANVPNSGITISSTGQVTGQVPGVTTPQALGQIQLAEFLNPEGLQQVGSNVFLQTEASGEPLVDNPGNQGIGVLSSGFLEGSNVDAVNELTSLIKTQRAFELNSQVITTSNEMLQTITRLKQ